jgi:methylenetetrahydrofolate reductase (NADPH)
MNISECYGPGKFGLSFELFPPKTAAGEQALYAAVAELVELNPSFITCTYGAGGSTREKTLDVVAHVRRTFQLPVASHLTCVGSSAGDLEAYLDEAARRGIDNIVALRGDPPRGETSFRPVAGGLRYASELVELVRRRHPQFGIAVAGYPETHQEAASPEADLANLKRKVDAGGDVVITQLFYDNDDFFRFRDRCDQLGIRVPIVPGLLPVTNLAQIQRITSLCGAKLPESFIAALAACDGDETAQFTAGVEFAARQAQQLIDQGVPGIHFYVLNKSPGTTQVLRSIRRPAAG